MGIENKRIISSNPEFKGAIAVDVTSLTPGRGYRVLAEIGPFYVPEKVTGVVLRSIIVHETGDTLVVVQESDKDRPRIRLSTAVLPIIEDVTPRPAHYPLAPTIRP